MNVSATPSDRTNPIEKGEMTVASKSSCCPWSRKTWRKIVVGTTTTTQMASLAVFIYGVVVKDNLLAWIGAGSGLGGAAICLMAHFATRSCEESEEASDQSSEEEMEAKPDHV